MIQANELRIGNYFFYSKQIRKVDSICKEGVNIELSIDTNIASILATPFNLISPIPLTPEILENWCGFEKKQNKWYNIKYFTDCEVAAEVMCISINLGTFRCSIYDVDEPSPCMTGLRIEYLHQLQNLHFSLTGKELPVTIQ